MADQEVINFDDFGFSDPLEPTEIKDLKESFVDTKPEEIQPIEEEVKIDILEELTKEEPEVVSEEGVAQTEEVEEEQVNQYKAFASLLKEEGLFYEDEEEEEIENGQQLLEKFRKDANRTAVNRLNEILQAHDPEMIDAFKAIWVDKVPIKKYLEGFNKIQSFKDIDLSDVDNQEYILKESWKSQGLSDATIKRRLTNFKDLGTLEEEAAEAHTLLLEKEEQNLQQLSYQKQQEELQRERQRQFYEHNMGQLISQKLKDKEIDGIPLNQKEADALYDYLVTPKWQTPTGELLTELDNFWIQLKNPENYELRLKVAALAKRNFDLSTIVKKEASKQTKEKFDFLAQKEKTAKRTNTFQDNFSINI